jgi:polysaccharide biosynthesis transport protein
MRSSNDGNGRVPRGVEVTPASDHAAVERWSAESAPSGGPDGEQSAALNRYVQIVRERWKTVGAVFLVIFVGVGAGSLLQEPVYRATGTIEIRKQAAEIVPMDALYQFERISDQYLQTEYATLRSRALLERTLVDPVLAMRLLKVLDPEAADTAAPDPASLARKVHRDVTIDPLTGSRIVRVSFAAGDAGVAADVVNGLVSSYALMRQESGSAALARLDEQADSVRAQLLAGERELQAFVRRSGLSSIVIGGSGGEIVPQERLRILQQELTAAEAESYRASAAAASATGVQSASLESDLLRSLRNRVAELEGEHARLRSTFTDSFPRVKQLRNELTQLGSLIAAEQQRVGSTLSTQHDATLRRRQLLQRAVDEQQRIMEDYAGKLGEYDRRSRDVQALSQLYTSLQQKRKEASVSSALSAMDVGILDAAAPPDAPSSPRPARDLPLGAIVGLVLGVGVAFLRDYTDGSLRSPDDMSSFASAPLLALIPEMPLAGSGAARATRIGGPARRWHRIDRPLAHDSPQLAEAIRGLRTSVLYDAGGFVPRTLLVTSSVPGEGKTTISTNLAISLAMMGRRVLLVDADMRRPSLHKVFGVPRQPGLTEELAEREPWTESLHRGVSPNLDLVTAGTHLGNPSDLLSAPALRRWLAEAAAAYDVVVIDAPALHINVPDGRILAHAVDGVLLVVRSGATPREVVRRLVAQTPGLVGIVMNQMDVRRLPSYYTEYGGTAHAPRMARNGAHDAEQKPRLVGVAGAGDARGGGAE